MDNQTDHKIETFWVSEVGKERAYEVLAPGQQIKQQTYVGHVWYLKRNGKPIGCFTVRPDDYVVFDKAFLNDIQFNNLPRTQNSRPLASAFASRDPRSPDRKWEVQVRDHNLWIESKGANSSKSQLTQNGTEKNTYNSIGSGTRWLKPSSQNPARSEVRWSPDSSRFIAYQTPVAPENRVHYIESKPKDQLQPLLRSYQYPKTGRLPFITSIKIVFNRIEKGNSCLKPTFRQPVLDPLPRLVSIWRSILDSLQRPRSPEIETTGDQCY